MCCEVLCTLETLHLFFMFLLEGVALQEMIFCSFRCSLIFLYLLPGRRSTDGADLDEATYGSLYTDRGTRVQAVGPAAYTSEL